MRLQLIIMVLASLVGNVVGQELDTCVSYTMMGMDRFFETYVVSRGLAGIPFTFIKD